MSHEHRARRLIPGAFAAPEFLMPSSWQEPCPSDLGKELVAGEGGSHDVAFASFDLQKCVGSLTRSWNVSHT